MIEEAVYSSIQMWGLHVWDSTRTRLGRGIALALASGIACAAERSTTMELSSSAFAPNADIPSLHTCEGLDQSPPLTWSGAPSGTRSLALVVDDPDAPDPAAPKMTWVHWVLYNLPPGTAGLAAGASGAKLPEGAREGLNDWQREGYGGPCPPIGRHRYVHKLYALDTVLPVLHPATKAELEKAMQGHILARAELVGHYRKGK
jgi:Raf kinase inhibitor-like YbhB/YbcL family protein